MVDWEKKSVAVGEGFDGVQGEHGWSDEGRGFEDEAVVWPCGGELVEEGGRGVVVDGDASLGCKVEEEFGVGLFGVLGFADVKLV